MSCSSENMLQRGKGASGRRKCPLCGLWGSSYFYLALKLLLFSTVEPLCGKKVHFHGTLYTAPNYKVTQSLHLTCMRASHQPKTVISSFELNIWGNLKQRDTKVLIIWRKKNTFCVIINRKPLIMCILVLKNILKIVMYIKKYFFILFILYKLRLLSCIYCKYKIGGVIYR